MWLLLIALFDGSDGISYNGPHYDHQTIKFADSWIDKGKKELKNKNKKLKITITNSGKYTGRKNRHLKKKYGKKNKKTKKTRYSIEV